MYRPTKRLATMRQQERIASQERHARLNRLLAETLTLKEAAERYDVSIAALEHGLTSCEEWRPRPGAASRFFIVDIDAIVEHLRARRARHVQRPDPPRGLWFLDALNDQ